MKRGIIYEYERVSDVVLSFPGYTHLNMVVDFGNKNKDGNKLAFMSQYKYASNKYKDQSSLISIKRMFMSYMTFEYPNPDKNSGIKSKYVYIYSYSILGLREKMKEFDGYLKKAFVKDEVDGKRHLYLSSGGDIHVISHTAKNNTIEFSPDIYYDGPNHDIECTGVCIVLNNEYKFTIRAAKEWKSLLYFMDCVDLYGWANTTASAMMSCAINPDDIIQIGKSDFGGGSNYDTADEDDDMIISSKNSKPLNNRERKQQFFDEN